MARAFEPVDVDGVPELARLAQEVRESGRPRLLRMGGEAVAVLTPLAHVPRRQSRPTERDRAAFRSAAGGWKGLVDADRLIEQIYADRRISDRPPVDL